MTDTIYKYEFGVGDTSTIQLPVGAEMLTVLTQHERPVLYARVDPSQMTEARMLYVRGTGHPLTGEEGPYLSSFTLQSGALVFHVFVDRVKPSETMKDKKET